MSGSKVIADVSHVDGRSGIELRGMLQTLPSLSNEQLSLVYHVIRREVEQRHDSGGRQRVGWALARDAW